MRTTAFESAERLQGIEEDLLKYLGALSARHRSRFVPEPPLSRLCQVAGLAPREVVVGRLAHLEAIGRLIPARCGDQIGWIFRLGREWRREQRRNHQGKPAATGGFNDADRKFLKACGITAT